MNIDEIHNQLKNHPSYIDRQNYEKKLKCKADKIQDNALEGLTGEELLDAIVDLEDKSFDAFIVGIACNLPEAKSLILTLKSYHISTKEVKQIVKWEPIFKHHPAYNGKVTKKMTYTQIVERLEEISHEEYGYDIKQWNKWLAAWELYPAPTGYR